MSFNRYIARIAAVQAISNFGVAPWPTIAGNRVFDSKIEPVEETQADQLVPVCVVYTDYDKNGWRLGQAQFGDRMLTFTFELLVVQRQPGEGEEPDVLLYPETDSELESALDIFESQLGEALMADNVAANAFRYFTIRPIEVISRRGATVEGGRRLAARQITLETKAAREPMNGAIPADIAAFLDALEAANDFADRVPDMRVLYTQRAGLNDHSRIMRAIGITATQAGILGLNSTYSPVMPQNVVWLDLNGQALD